MTDTAEYITLLVISVAVTIAVGRVLSVSGEPFLQEVFEDEKVTTSVNRLLSVLFHLITIGVLTIISVWTVDVGSQLQNMVVKIGIVLIVLGIAYGISMLVLIRVRQQRRARPDLRGGPAEARGRRHQHAPDDHAEHRAPRPARGSAERPVTVHPGPPRHTEAAFARSDLTNAASARSGLRQRRRSPTTTVAATATSAPTATTDATAEPCTKAVVAASCRRCPSTPPTRPASATAPPRVSRASWANDRADAGGDVQGPRVGRREHAAQHRGAEHGPHLVRGLRHRRGRSGPPGGRRGEDRVVGQGLRQPDPRADQHGRRHRSADAVQQDARRRSRPPRAADPWGRAPGTARSGRAGPRRRPPPSSRSTPARAAGPPPAGRARRPAAGTA